MHDPKLREGNVLVSEPERAVFRELEQLGLETAFVFSSSRRNHSWWDYRMMAFRRNMGLRIDHILLSEALIPVCTDCTIDRAPRKLERPSDHTPVVANIVI